MDPVIEFVKANESLARQVVEELPADRLHDPIPALGGLSANYLAWALDEIDGEREQREINLIERVGGIAKYRETFASGGSVDFPDTAPGPEFDK